MNLTDEQVADITNAIIPNDAVKTTSKQIMKEKNERIMKEVQSLTAENYTNENVSLYHGDCLVEMNKIQDDSVDLVLCDIFLQL
jgi:hypothetical protein